MLATVLLFRTIDDLARVLGWRDDGLSPREFRNQQYSALESVLGAALAGDLSGGLRPEWDSIPFDQRLRDLGIGAETFALAHEYAHLVDYHVTVPADLRNMAWSWNNNWMLIGLVFSFAWRWPSTAG